MSIALDGFKVLKRLGDAPEMFASVRADADKAARTLVVKCLKAKSTGIETVRGIRKALHDKPFELLIDGLKPAELKSMLTKLDKHFPNLKTMHTLEQRAHLLALAGGAADPSRPPAKAPKVAKAKKAGAAKRQEPRRLQSDVMDLFRARGKSRDDD